MPKVSYNRILDEHLHTLIAQGNHEALERLKRRYHYLLFFIIRCHGHHKGCYVESRLSYPSFSSDPFRIIAAVLKVNYYDSGGR